MVPSPPLPILGLDSPTGDPFLNVSMNLFMLKDVKLLIQPHEIGSMNPACGLIYEITKPREKRVCSPF